MKYIDPYIVIGQDNCSYCEKAVKLLNDRGDNCSYVALEHATWLKPILALANIKTVPLIINPQNMIIGGFEELEKYLEGIS